MKRLITSLCIFIFLMAVGISELLFLKSTRDKLCGITDRILYAYLDDDGEEAVSLALSLEYEWKRAADILNIFVRTEKLSAAQNSVYRIDDLLSSDSDEVPAELSALTADINWLYRRELPIWSNIF